MAFTAAVVGGIGSIPGAMLGGLAIGLGRAFADRVRLVGVPGRDRLRDPDRRSCCSDRPASSARRRRRRSEMSDVDTSDASRHRGRRSARTNGSRARASATTSSAAAFAGAPPGVTRVPNAGGASRSSSRFVALIPVMTHADKYTASASDRHARLRLARARASTSRSGSRACSTSGTSPTTASERTATRCSPRRSSDIHWPAWAAIPSSSARRSPRVLARAAVAAARRRLPRDRDALLRRRSSSRSSTQGYRVSFSA